MASLPILQHCPLLAVLFGGRAGRLGRPVGQRCLHRLQRQDGVRVALDLLHHTMYLWKGTIGQTCLHRLQRQDGVRVALDLPQHISVEGHSEQHCSAEVPHQPEAPEQAAAVGGMLGQ